MDDLRRFAVERFCFNDFSTKGLADTLMAEADAEQWKIFTRGNTDHLEAYACMVGVGRAGGNDDAFGLQIKDLFRGDFIIAMDDDILPQIPEILDQVVGKTVVVINQDNHGLFLWLKRVQNSKGEA